MRTFNDYTYQRPNMQQVEERFNEALLKFSEAQSIDDALTSFDVMNEIRREFDTMSTLASIRHSIDTKDSFYDAEESFFNDHRPVFEQLENRLYKALTQSRFENELREVKGNLLFDKARQSLKTFNDEILEDLKKENKLTFEYQKLLASAEIDFEGEVRNLSQMAPFSQSKDRQIRKAAAEEISRFFEANEEKLDTIYDQLVQLRHQMAIKLGYDNYVQLAYDKLGRLDYTSDDVANYRSQVKEYLVPLVKTLIERQAKRLNIEKMKSYDLPLDFLSGNPTPKGDRSWMVDQARTMYYEMSPETKAFFDFMEQRQLMDLDAKKGKAGGGYCTYIFDYQSPFIFANFNGTSHDVDVLTHEAGHAFQVFMSRDYDVLEYIWPTLEACEIHSMSMEFFAWPWMNSFFKEDTDKYRFSHIEGALKFIPYGVAVDEFQHRVYEQPSMTPAERKALWRSLEKTYMPYKDYDGNAFLERGGFWFRQGHIFSVPFYYIDYTLAQVCAFQYWNQSQVDYQSAWNSYLKLCQAGGSQTFLQLLQHVNLKNPFESGTIASILPSLKAFLDSIDDTKF